MPTRPAIRGQIVRHLGSRSRRVLPHGVDEHANEGRRGRRSSGLEPQEYADRIAGLREFAGRLNAEVDFIRTSDEGTQALSSAPSSRHVRPGDIYEDGTPACTASGEREFKAQEDLDA